MASTVAADARCGLDDILDNHHSPLTTSVDFMESNSSQVGLCKLGPSLDRRFQTAGHEPSPSTEPCRQPHVLFDVTDSRPLINHHACEECHLGDECNADSGSPQGKIGESPHYGSCESRGSTEHHATLQAGETGTLMKRDGEVERHAPPSCQNTAEGIDLDIFARGNTVSHSEIECRDHYQSDERRQNSLNSIEQPYDQCSVSNTTANEIVPSHFNRTEDFVMPTKTSDCGREIDLKEVGPAIQYFDIDKNTSSAFVVKLRDTVTDSWRTPKPWVLLESLDCAQWNGNNYCRGDVIYVRTGAEEKAVDIFEVADIRCLGDSRSVLRGFWYYQRSEIGKSIGKAGLRMWQKRYVHVKTTHTDVVMWDCATGHLLEVDQNLIAPGLICDMSGDSWMIRSSNEEAVRWAKT